jgi:hypothetical protein
MMIEKDNIGGISPSTPRDMSVKMTEKNVGRVVTILARVVEYDTTTGRALVVPADYERGMVDEMTIPFIDILHWHERKATGTARKGVK